MLTLLVVVIILFLVLVDLEVPQLVVGVRGSNHTKPVTKIVLLQVLLCQVFQVSLGEVSFRDDGNLVLGSLEGDLFQVVQFSLNLYPSVQEVFQVINFHDAILNWVSAINVECQCRLLLGGFLCGGHDG